MATQNGVYETATGDLLRVGIGVDFVNDGSFDSSNETFRTDVPIPGKVRGDANHTNMHRWNGSVWVEVTQPLVPIISDFISDMALGGWNPSANLIAHYLLDDIKSTAAVLDASPNGFDGVMIGGNTEDINADGLLSVGSSHDFDGSTHAHNIDAAIASGDLPTATKGTFCCVIEPDVVATDALRFIGFGDANAVTEIALMQGAVDGTIRAWCRIAGTMQWDCETDSVVISNGTKAWVVLVHDGTAPKIFVGDAANGMRDVPITFSVSTNKTKWFNDATGLDTGRIGVKEVNGSTGKYFNGRLDDARIYDAAWSIDDAIGWFNNGLGTQAESGMIPWKAAEARSFLGVVSAIIPLLSDGRLTLATGTPVPPLDQTAKTSVLYTPYVGNRIALYGGSSWKIFTFAELTLTVPSTTNKNFDVFAYDNAGNVTLESVDWTNDTTRATGLVKQDGVFVKSGATDRRYLGTCRTTGVSGKTEDSEAKRFVWNEYNRARRKLKILAAEASHTYTSQTWRPYNNDATIRVGVVVGLPNSLLDLIATATTHNATGSTPNRTIGIGEDKTNGQDVDLYTMPGRASSTQSGMAKLVKAVATGFHFYQLVQISEATGSTIWFGSIQDATRKLQTGIVGSINA